MLSVKRNRDRGSRELTDSIDYRTTVTSYAESLMYYRPNARVIPASVMQTAQDIGDRFFGNGVKRVLVPWRKR